MHIVNIAGSYCHCCNGICVVKFDCFTSNHSDWLSLLFNIFYAYIFEKSVEFPFKTNNLAQEPVSNTFQYNNLCTVQFEHCV